jgi:predicted PurR-regulated permease PerM
MIAMMESIQRSFLPALLLGLVTGVLALIPMVGWLLGFAVFILVNKYTARSSFATDLIVMMLMWVIIRQLAAPLFGA